MALADNNFDDIATGDESWSKYIISSDLIFVSSRNAVIRRIVEGIGSKKTMLIIFFTLKRIIVLDILSKGMKYNQDYFLNEIYPSIDNNSFDMLARNWPNFKFHMNNSICHNRSKIMDRLASKRIIHIFYPLYSPDVNPCDFWRFDFRRTNRRIARYLQRNKLFHKFTITRMSSFLRTFRGCLNRGWNDWLI
jgi:hypothetical protein